ncbi:MAG TPA: hypothetical protein PLV68_09810, partial [Ilumatobacteraceae bacterium]|nr:hypothetical protein [Ilumatobacteraceae bacterium]
MGSPVVSDQVWFAHGQGGASITEQYVIFNPTDQAVSVDVLVLGIGLPETFVPPEPVDIAAGGVATVDTATFTGLPEGAHALVFS